MTSTPLHWKIVIDAHDPHAQAEFWAAALGYVVEDHSVLVGELLAAGVVSDDVVTEHRGRRAWRDGAGARHPDDPFDAKSGIGRGRRLLFNRVPDEEVKTVKNRVHLDVHSKAGERDADVERIRGLGAAVQAHVKENGSEWIVMTDPEGNEFCVS
ncbi:VOC family protein [Actinomadura parmotrematis]|uniref:Glyoxalase-like domain-containing protein n=1 Tax=Actinomadura parmotrematis TaxID=2864039 RepID=A0ABS7FPT4_9ACTN|nr:VOC family protein [Actinomadura parmotrematis]MBW8482389.1 hypothetical protein [Actinomadura parmotrematis]